MVREEKEIYPMPCWRFIVILNLHIKQIIEKKLLILTEGETKMFDIVRMNNVDGINRPVLKKEAHQME